MTLKTVLLFLLYRVVYEHFHTNQVRLLHQTTFASYLQKQLFQSWKTFWEYRRFWTPSAILLASDIVLNIEDENGGQNLGRTVYSAVIASGRCIDLCTRSLQSHFYSIHLIGPWRLFCPFTVLKVHPYGKEMTLSVGTPDDRLTYQSHQALVWMINSKVQRYLFARIRYFCLFSSKRNQQAMAASAELRHRK